MIVSCRNRTCGVVIASYGMRTSSSVRVAEQHVELREAEHERVGSVDQRDLDLVAERRG